MSTFVTIVLALAALQFAFVYATFRVRAYRGPLTLLGNSKWQGNGKIRTYSTIEIGEDVLNEVAITNSLDNYLDGALRLPGDTTLHVAGAGWGRLFGIGHRILAIELPDGKRYYTRMSMVPAAMFIVLGIVLIPVLGVGLLILPMGLLLLMHVVTGQRLGRQGGRAVDFSQVVGS